jgi:hypothetical protein
LLAAREPLYPVTIHLLDIVQLEDQNLKDPWPITVTYGQPINIIASGAVLEELNRENPEAVTSLADAIKAERAEVCGGCYVERDDPLLPVESQLWNLGKGLAVTRQLVASDVRVFARRRFGGHPQLPAWLNLHDINRAIVLPGNDRGLPAYHSPVLSWSTQDGQQIECFLRKPLATGSVDTFFNLGHHLFKTTREDHTATLAFIHGQRQALPWYGDLLELSRLAQVAGRWTTVSNYFSEATAGDYAGSLGADDFHFDYLTPRARGEKTAPPAPPQRGEEKMAVSGFASHVRLRRRIDSCWTLAAMQRGLTGRGDQQHIEPALTQVEDQLEICATEPVPSDLMDRLEKLESQIAGSLAERLLARPQTQQPGWMLLNPCSFTRRLALELDAADLAALENFSADGRASSHANRAQGTPGADPVKAVQVDGDKLRLVAEIPPLGFAWLPKAVTRTGSPGHGKARMRLADERCVRNEFFEAEIDRDTGGLRAIRDHKTLVNRISERLIFRPGSVMKAAQVKTTSTGPALGEILSEGALLGDQNQVLARFRQRFRAWLGRPILDIRIELYPEQWPAGDPWHSYFGVQFAWRDERAMLLRGLGGTEYVTTLLRPQTPDYLEIRLARQSTTIFPGGLPFHQREGGRMLDVVLLPAGESSQIFDLAIGLDREQPMQTALGLVTPAVLVPTAKGPPHVGAKGWLFHLDASNLVLTSMRPGGQEIVADGSGPCDLTDAITARLLECGGCSTPAELRCVRNPQRVAIIDASGHVLTTGTQSNDAARFHAGPGSFLQLQLQFSV